MKVIASDDKAVTFLLDADEQRFFLQLLRLYPLTPVTHPRLSREINDGRVEEYQKQLEEALAAERGRNRAHVETWLAAQGRFPEGEEGVRLVIERSDSEWLLQVLNDVRVGSWLILGSPEESLAMPQTDDPKQFQAWAVMQATGFFQMFVLHAFSSQA